MRQRRNTPDVLAAPMAGGALGGGSSGGGGGNNNDGVSSSTTTTTTTDSAAVRRARRAGHDDGEDQEDEDREDREDEENGRRDETGPGGKRSSDWSEEASGEEDEERASSYAMKYTGHRNLLTVKQVLLAQCVVGGYLSGWGGCEAIYVMVDVRKMFFGEMQIMIVLG